MIPVYINIVKVTNYSGGSLEANWRMNCQLVEDDKGEVFVNTPGISGDVFEAGGYRVGFGDKTFGRTSGNSYRTISIN